MEQKSVSEYELITAATLYESITLLVSFKFQVVQSVTFPAPVELVPFMLGKVPLKDGMVLLPPAAARPGSLDEVVLVAGVVALPAAPEAGVVAAAWEVVTGDAAAVEVLVELEDTTDDVVVDAAEVVEFAATIATLVVVDVKEVDEVVVVPFETNETVELLEETPDVVVVPLDTTTNEVVEVVTETEEVVEVVTGTKEDVVVVVAFEDADSVEVDVLDVTTASVVVVDVVTVEVATEVVVVLPGCAATADAGLYPSGTAFPPTGATTSVSLT